MKSILDVLSSIVSDAFEKCGYDKKLGEVTSSDRLDLCQFQCNGSFEGAKLYRKAPVMIAKEVAAVLSENTETFKNVEAVAPGFINMTISTSYMLNIINDIANDENCGVLKSENQKTIVIDFGGPNVAKPLHIGHLRSAIIGESIKRLAKISGHKVIGDIHLGDWGLQIGLVIAELSERYPDWKCFSEEFDAEKDEIPALTADLLNEVYPFASKKSKENDAFKEKAHQFTAELQKEKPNCIALWKEIMRVSIADLKGNYDKLNVSFDLWYGESDAEKHVDELIAILKDKNLLYESDGALVVDVEEETDKAPMPPVIIKKSDNSNLYATTDLATIIQRQKDFNPDKIWYVVDARQGLHFTQVFRCAKKAEIIPAKTELEFLNFGTMNGSDGKPYKTREGGVMKLEDLLNNVTSAALEKLNNSTYINSLSEEEKLDLASKVGIAAVKFGDLINHRAKDYVFDLDKFLSFEGKTGTYILYTITRMNSILKKAGVSYDEIIPLEDIYSDVEAELLLKIMLTGEAFLHAIEEKAPNYICDNAFVIASIFSSFYHDNHVLDEKDEQKKKSWLGLILLTRKVLLKHLDVLGIDAVENM